MLLFLNQKFLFNKKKFFHLILKNEAPLSILIQNFCRGIG
nr:MAG TPA: hypothetical protein [Caudoviricetes sp.]